MQAFYVSLGTCEKALHDLDEESLHDFSSVGSTIKEVKEQLDAIQVSKSVSSLKKFELSVFSVSSCAWGGRSAASSKISRGKEEITR